MNRLNTAVLITLAAVLAFAGCKAKQPVETAAGPDYSRQLQPGESALRLISDPNRWPDVAAAFQNCRSDPFTLDALDESARWFEAPSSRQFYPFEGISHDQAHASVLAFMQLIQSSPDERAFMTDVKKMFDAYESVGYNNEGTVLFTGYYSPVFPGSKTRTDRFQFPLYKRPADLASDPKTGQPLGRKLPNGTTVPYYTRKQIEQTKMFAGSELCWVEDALSAYIIHVNGSARLRLQDGSEMHIGYAGKTDRPYVGLGKTLLDEKIVKPNELSLRKIRELYRANPQQIIDMMNRNESYVFFTEYSGEKWPAGSLGVKVSTEATLATDKRIYPRGGMVLVDTQQVTFDMGKKRFLRFMLDQDTGGAIQAPGRADIFMGIGPSAEILAGGQYAEGKLYYFFLKPQYVQQFLPPSSHKTMQAIGK